MVKKQPTTEEKKEIPMKKEIRRGIPIPWKLSKLREKLGCKAKQEPGFRFYALYDRIYRMDTLQTAYCFVRANGGCPGVDNVSFEEIEKADGGIALYLQRLQKELEVKKYKPLPVKRVYIPKPNGKKRPLGIPCIKDRIVQMATVLIIEPIFEEDFQDCSHGFRPERRCSDAIQDIQNGLNRGLWHVYDADLSSYFDTVDHGILMEKIEKRITDRSVLNLIRMWLNSCIVDRDGDGKTRITKPRKGTPQGGVISPLLANIYLDEFDKAFHSDPKSPRWSASAILVRYADDFVLLAKTMNKGIKSWITEIIEEKLKLSINKEKTTVQNFYRKSKATVLDFLGFSMRFDRDLKGRDYKYLNTYPSKNSQGNFKMRIKSILRRNRNESIIEAIDEVNKFTRGWYGYFRFPGYPKKACRDLDHYTRESFKRFLKQKSQRTCKLTRNGESHYKAFKRLGLCYMSEYR